jgi:hypothetical protein
MKKLVALREVYYASKTHYVGDAFEASDQDATILVGLGKTRYEDAPPIAPQPPLQTRALQAEATPAAQPMTTTQQSALVPPAPVRKKRTYKRRDMRAED